MDKSAGSMWGIDNSIVVLMSSSRLLKSINSILEKYAGSGLNSISRIILRSDSCLARRPVGRISSSLMGFRGLLYGIGLCGIVFFADSEMLKTILFHIKSTSCCVGIGFDILLSSSLSSAKQNWIGFCNSPNHK